MIKAERYAHSALIVPPFGLNGMAVWAELKIVAAYIVF